MTETTPAPVEVSPHPLARLFDPGTVRSRCAAITRAALDDVSPHFTIERSRLAAVADRVVALTQRRFPDLRVPMRELPGRLDELPRDRDVVVVCHHGVRSRQVAHYLVRLGYMAVWNLTGGVAAWADQVDPAMPRY